MATRLREKIAVPTAYSEKDLQRWIIQVALLFPKYVAVLETIADGTRNRLFSRCPFPQCP